MVVDRFVIVKKFFACVFRNKFYVKENGVFFTTVNFEMINVLLDSKSNQLIGNTHTLNVYGEQSDDRLHTSC